MSDLVQFTRNQSNIIVGSTLHPGKLPYEKVLTECERYIADTYNFRERVKFVIGDLLNAMHTRYKHGWSQCIPDIQALFDNENAIATLVNWASVCDRIPVHIRTDLSFTHHANVAYVSLADCKLFCQHEPRYVDYCEKHEIVSLNITSLQMFLLGQGKNMTARKLHNYRMRILAGNPTPNDKPKTPPAQVLRGVQSKIREIMGIIADNSISAENRLNTVNEFLKSLLDVKIDNVVPFERKAQ